MVTIINYGSGNITAICNIYKSLNIEFQIANTAEDIENSSKLLLPGVGDFDETIKLLNNLGFCDALNRAVLNKGIPILGVCVGMQILGESSEEGNEKGFGWIKGRTRKFDASFLKTKPYIPHMGWNNVIKKKENLPILNNIDEQRGFYFLHSYYFECENEHNVIASTNYGIEFASGINDKNIYGFQFHPEKSHRNGIEVLKNFAII
jgi:glutamine amidotransferase